MFTGIVTDIGRVASLERDAAGARLRIECAWDPEAIGIGASIACAGVCLTAVARGAHGEGAWFEADASPETLELTTIGTLAADDRINLEKSLKVGDELSGHLVQGHVDGTARIVEVTPDGASRRFVFEAPEALSRFIAPKGAVTLDGTSLTVNEVDGARFGVNVIPHTSEVTTWQWRQAGDLVNLEVDVLARYLARLAECLEGGR